MINDENAAPQTPKRGASLKTGLGGGGSLLSGTPRRQIVGGGPAARPAAATATTAAASTAGTPLRGVGLAPANAARTATTAPSTPNITVRTPAAGTPGSRATTNNNASASDDTVVITAVDAKQWKQRIALKREATKQLSKEQQQKELGKLYDQAIRVISAERVGVGARIWLEYAELQADAFGRDEGRDVFKRMKSKSIGIDDAAFYVSWAQLEVEDGKPDKAKKIFEEAKQRGERKGLD